MVRESKTSDVGTHHLLCHFWTLRNRFILIGMPLEELGNDFTCDPQVYYQSALCHFACCIRRQQVRKRRDSIQSCNFRDKTPPLSAAGMRYWSASCSCIITPRVLACWASQIWNIGFCAHAKSYRFLVINRHIFRIFGLLVAAQPPAWLWGFGLKGCQESVKVLATDGSLYTVSSFEDKISACRVSALLRRFSFHSAFSPQFLSIFHTIHKENKNRKKMRCKCCPLCAKKHES